MKKIKWTRLRVLTAALLISLIGAGATLAAVAAQSNLVQNVFTAKDVDVKTEIPETVEVPDIPLGPGLSHVTKQVAVNNNGSASIYVRVRVAVSPASVFADVSDIKAGAEKPGSVGEGEIAIIGRDENWTYGEDGYYYYLLPVAGGASTETLMREVWFSNFFSQDFEITIYEESIIAAAVTPAGETITAADIADAFATVNNTKNATVDNTMP
ncbi:MAG: hypothetical protein HFI38_04880 [Lachnospiraceae bacterium]|jgi:hypothetical protein|nr:hypothetical protein [Lachnospiraceae bacterium]